MKKPPKNGGFFVVESIRLSGGLRTRKRMTANYQLRRLKRLKQADSGAKQDTRRSTNAGDAIAEKQKKNEQKGLTYPM